MLLASIHEDHRNINRLLKLLTENLLAIRNEKPVNFSLIKDIVSYLKEHAERYHHPKEDLIYRYYLSHYADTDGIEQLDAEHENLSALTEEFALTIDMVLMDAVIPLDVFAERLNGFVSRQREHLELEETSILPVISRILTAEDWNEIQLLCTEEGIDPLFGDSVAARFKNLASAIE